MGHVFLENSLLPDTPVNASGLSAHSLLTNLSGSSYHLPHFTETEPEAQRVGVASLRSQAVRTQAGIRTQALCPQGSHPQPLREDGG